MRAKRYSVVAIVAATLFVALPDLGCKSRNHTNDYRVSRNAPLERNGPTLSLNQIDAVMGQKLTVVTKVADIPEAAKTSFCNLERCNFEGGQFDMVDPGEAMSTDDIIPGVPNKKLVIAALGENAAVVLYVRGGFADRLCVTVFDFRARAAWGAYVNDYDVRDLSGLRKAIAARSFVPWSANGSANR